MKGRLLIMGPLDGPTNMALDEAILLQANPSPALRLYSWSGPWLSIGYSQVVQKDVDVAACQRLGIGLVRRPTGGGAILHHAELTYCLVAPEDHDSVKGSILESYCKVSRGLVAGLTSLGINPEMTPADCRNNRSSSSCFLSPSAYEVVVGGRKLAGSAQWRHRGMLLQHGSVLLDLDPLLYAEVLKLPPGEDRDTWAGGFARRAVCLREALGRSIGFAEAADAIVRGYKEALRLELQEEGLTEQEWEAADALRSEKYGSPDWNLAR